MGHDEDAWQLIPLVVIAMAVLASTALLWVDRGSDGVRPGSDRGQTSCQTGVKPRARARPSDSSGCRCCYSS